MPENSGDTGELSLGPNMVDRRTALARSIAGAVPFLGASLQEVISSVIPNQRLDRLTDFVRRLETKLSQVERDILEAGLASNPEAVDLFEESMIQAARAVKGSRRDNIASLLKSSLTSEELDYVEKSKLWQLFDSLNDVELLLLQSYGIQGTPDAEVFVATHQEALRGPRAHLGSSEGEADRAAVYATFRQHLVDLGLLKPRFKRVPRGDLPEFDDKTGMMKATGYRLTRLGGLLLRQLGLPTRI